MIILNSEDPIVKDKKINNGYNSVPKIVFTPNKTSRIISIVLIAIIDVIAFYGVFIHGEIFDENLLKELSQLSITVILAIVALGISVFQSDRSIIGEGNSVDNKKELYIRYVFGIFPAALVTILGFIVAVFFKGTVVIRFYSLAMILITTKTISGTIASFVSYLNIRD